MLTRRAFLQTTAVGLSAMLLPRTGRAAAAPPVLVALYMRGGADGLNLIVPAGDPLYHDLRPTIAVPAGSELPLDGFYGLHPGLADLLPLYQSGELCFIHACGSTDPSRSHFLAQDFMERAAPGNKTTVDGWLNRYLAIAGGGSPIAGVTLKTAKVKAMVGPAPSLAFSRIGAFDMSGESVDVRRAALATRYELLPGTLLGSSTRDALATIDLIRSVSTATSVVYPVGPLGDALADAAALIKADIGVRVIAVDLGGWDHHTDEQRRIEEVGGDLAASLRAFLQDLGINAVRTLTLCMTEFGRRARENGGEGTDHGHGGVMLVLGGGAAGGRVMTRDGRWPGLAPDRLSNGEDLAVTTDFRDVFAEILNRHMLLSITDCASIFPGFSVETRNFPGLYV